MNIYTIEGTCKDGFSTLGQVIRDKRLSSLSRLESIRCYTIFSFLLHTRIFISLAIYNFLNILS